MGIMQAALQFLFGSGRNVVKDTVEVFRENAEASSERDAAYRAAALSQFAAEFAFPRKGLFDRFMDGLNRVPRPALAFGTIGLFIAAMVDPVWFATRMQGISLVPEPLWWLLGAIVSFYFGARFQTKGQDFQRSMTGSVLLAQQVADNISTLEGVYADGRETDQMVDISMTEDGTYRTGPNAALDEWRAIHDK